MVLVVAKHAPQLLRNKQELMRTFCHPAYLVENWERGIADANLRCPQAKLGPELAAIDIIAIDSDGEEIEQDPSAPPAQPASQPMLPPEKYTLENYKNNRRRGRPRTRRFRSRGAVSSDGGAAPPNAYASGTTDVHAAIDDFLDDL